MRHSFEVVVLAPASTLLENCAANS